MPSSQSKLQRRGGDTPGPRLTRFTIGQRNQLTTCASLELNGHRERETAIAGLNDLRRAIFMDVYGERKRPRNCSSTADSSSAAGMRGRPDAPAYSFTSRCGMYYR